MITLNAFTNGFAYQHSSTGPKLPRRVRWVYYQHRFDGPTVFEDGHMREYDPRAIETPLRIGWLQEARALRPENYATAWERRDLFDYILTYDAELLAADPAKFKRCPRMGVHVPRGQWGLHYKSADAALIATHKHATPGHLLRAQIAERFKGRIAVYGQDAWANKAAVFAAHRFVIAVEAEAAHDYFTEHLLDAVALGCMPLYWGAPNVGDYLDADGIATFQSLDELDDLLAGIERYGGAALYELARPALERNLARLSEYEMVEDWIVEHSELRDVLAAYDHA